MNKKVSVVMKLPQLQNLMKRDPTAYRDEFLMQKRHFDSEIEIFKLRPTKDSERFTELVTFMSHVASCYKSDCTELPVELMELLETQASVLHADVRTKLFQAIIMMRNRNLIDPVVVIKLCFKLFAATTDKTLRQTLGDYLINDIKSINSKKQNDSLNRRVQALLFNVVKEDTSVAARKTVHLLSELYRKRVWTDARTVNVLGSACYSDSIRVVVGSIKFFLGIEMKMFEDEDEEKAKVKTSKVNLHEHSKKTKSRIKHVERQKEKEKKDGRDQQNKHNQPLFPAIQMLNDPQSLVHTIPPIPHLPPIPPIPYIPPME